MSDLKTRLETALKEITGIVLDLQKENTELKDDLEQVRKIVNRNK